ncbi:MAG: GntR family transcriptional regulator [Candidatus Aminicenantes bacterium]|nr:GntR family transcriptional regulator [Candidatus Aminicenantes bacterium]
MTDPKPILTIKSLKEQVYEHLREQLRTGGLRPGAAIDMEETSKRLGVSKTPLRDALLQLEMEGFVTILPRRKIVVNVLTLREIREFYEIIGALESAALGTAFPRLREEEVRRMEKLNAEMKAAIARDDFDLYYRKNLAFHDVFLGLSDNEGLKKTVRLLKKRLYDFPRLQGFVKEWEQASIGEHAELLALIRDGRREEAAAHIRNTHWSFAVQEKFINRYYAKASAL